MPVMMPMTKVIVMSSNAEWWLFLFTMSDNNIVVNEGLDK